MIADGVVPEPAAGQPWEARDLDAFLASLAGLRVAGEPAFDRARPLVVARAPGRLDVMGGFADYSGSLTLEMPIAEAALAAVQRRTDERVRLTSLGLDGQSVRFVEFPLGEFRARASTWVGARDYFRRDPDAAWAGYVGGALTALAEEHDAMPDRGLDLVLCSRVPEGKGVSSSAAIEVATFYALSAASGVAIDPIGAALSCQRIENLVVGAPCGVMDQMTSSCGVSGQLLPLLCQPAELQPCFPIPEELALWGIDSGLRHQVSGADYTEVRVAAFMGYRMIADLASLEVEPVGPGRVRVRDDAFGGYLANVPRSRFVAELSPRLPERMRGRDFLERYHGITDDLTRVRPDSTYPVRAATAHPVFEHQRALEYRTLMQRKVGLDEGKRLGELMTQAHRSYSACGIGSTGTDRLTQLVAEEGSGAGLYGAKITGGGSGGTVAVLARADGAAAVARVAKRYAAEAGHEPHVFSGSSPGAASHGVRSAVWRSGGWRLP